MQILITFDCAAQLPPWPAPSFVIFQCEDCRVCFFMSFSEYFTTVTQKNAHSQRCKLILLVLDDKFCVSFPFPRKTLPLDLGL